MTQTRLTRAARAVSLGLALLCILPVLGGCMTSALYEGIRSAPRLKTEGFPAVDKAHSYGELVGTRASFRAYQARDPLWTGKDVSRPMTLLVPADRTTPALLVSRSVYPSEMSGDQDRIAACTKDSLLAAAVVKMGFAPTSRTEVLVWVSGLSAAGEDSMREAAVRRAEALNLTGAFLVLYDGSYRYRSLHSATRGSPGAAASGWEWSPPIQVEDCLPKPTGGWTFSRLVLPLGYLVTVPVDIVTSPIQLLGVIIFLIMPFRVM